VDKVIFIGKKFTLGKCRCGCGADIPIRPTTKRVLLMYKVGHILKINPEKRIKSLPRGDRHYNWGNGKQKSNGYYMLYKPDYPFSDSRGRIFEHRYVWEITHKACLLKWSHVHHKDGNKINNEQQNLEAMMFKNHLSLEHAGKRVIVDLSKRLCDFCGCGTTFDYYKTGLKRYHWYRDKFDNKKWRCKKCYFRVLRSQ
jgi:hypothetical protein